MIKQCEKYSTTKKMDEMMISGGDCLHQFTGKYLGFLSCAKNEEREGATSTY